MTHRGCPPVSMKFSERTSNQSTAGRRERMWPKWTVRRPTPMPRSGRSQRFICFRRQAPAASGARFTRAERAGGLGGAPLAPPSSIKNLLQPFAAALALAGALSGLGRDVRRVDRDLAAAFALARVLAGAAVVAALATAHTLAVALALA